MVKRNTCRVGHAARGLAALVLGGLLWLSQAPSANAAAPRALVIEALGQVRGGQAAAAYERLRPLEPRYGGDTEFDYVLGLAALEAGKPGEAVRILSRVVKKRPDLLPPRAELGRALLTLGDLGAAREAFADLVQDRRLPQQVRDTLGRYIQDIDRILAARQQGVIAPGTTRIGGFYEFRVGYDTNVNAATNDREILIPFFAALGPATISATGRARPDIFGEASAGLSIVHALATDQALYLNVVGTAKIHGKVREFDAQVVGAEAGYARDFGAYGRFTIALIGQTQGLDYRAFRHAVGVAGLWTRNTPAGFTSTITATYTYLSFVGTDSRDAHRFVAGLTLGQRVDRLGGTYFFGTVQGGTERTTSLATDHFSHDLLTLRVGADVPLRADLSLFTNGSVEWRNFRADFPLFFYPRRDREFIAALGLDWRFAPGWRLRPVVNFTFVESNINLFDQRRWVFSVAARREF